MTTKLSVSLSDEDVAYLDEIASAERNGNRSAVIHDMVRLFREIRYEDAYRQAFEEWEGSEDQKLWNTTVADGLGSSE
ncbi:ribbon-helix-helix domain-containing protein [Leifsonia sp. 2TAF2]|uniref:ribbon-helix-helix domain-containing protein n=1 Tax=Leifsonia sp. 2TAF2 TaxID=3233009 RepID=UPI003F99818F